MEARDVLHERPRAFELALRIRHPSLDPAVISRELKLEPEHSFRAGEPRESVSGIAAAAVHPESYWLATLDPGEWPAEHLRGLEFPSVPRASSQERMRVMVSSLGMALTLSAVHFLRAHAEFLKRVLTEGGDAALLVEVPMEHAQSFTLTPQVTKVISDLGVSLDFEFTND
jgi:hypothetical protein